MTAPPMPPNLSLESLSLRLLLPIPFPPSSLARVAHALSSSTTSGRRDNAESIPLWTPAELHPEYTSELTLAAAECLFPPGHPTRFVLNPSLAQSWFRDSAIVPNGQLIDRWLDDPTRPRPRATPFTLNPFHSVELLILSRQLALFSITLDVPFSPASANSLAEARSLVYFLSHLKQRVAVWRIRHPQSDSDLSSNNRIPIIPNEFDYRTTPLESRLGHAGQPVSLSEFTSHVLQPLTAIHCNPVQKQFIAHAVFFFSETTNFLSGPYTTFARTEIAGISQIEEADHAPSAAAPSTCSIECLTANHLVAYSPLAAVHFVAFQNPSPLRAGSFDAERPLRIQTKYATPFFLSLCQRFAAQSLLQRFTAASILRHCSASTADYDATGQHFHDIWHDALLLQSSALLVDISRRPSINRCFHLAGQAQNLCQILAKIHLLTRDVESHLHAEHQADQAARLGHMQSRIGHIEVFIVSFYTFELTHGLAEVLHFDHPYTIWGVAIFVPLAILLAVLNHHSGRLTRRLPASVAQPEPSLLHRAFPQSLAVVVLAFFGWIAWGFLRSAELPLRRPNPTTPTLHGSAEPQSTPKPASVPVHTGGDKQTDPK